MRGRMRVAARLLVALLLYAACGAAATEAEAPQGSDANTEYQLGRKAFEAGDLATAEPHFLRAAEIAPQYPEPHYALAQIMMRQGRHAEAQQRMALAQKHMPPAPASAANAIAAAPADAPSLAVLAAKASASLPSSHYAVGRTLSLISGYLADGEAAIAKMAASSDPQDQHNAPIHRAQHVQTEEIFRRLVLAPTDAGLWWQLALQSFNQRRDHMSASAAFAVTASLSSAPMVVMSFYLAFHAWQHLCDWRQWEARLHMLSARVHASLGDVPLAELGPGKRVRYSINQRTASAALPPSPDNANADGGSAASAEGGGGEGGSGGSGGSGGGIFGFFGGADASKSSPPPPPSGYHDGGAASSEHEALVHAMESPYIFLVTRLTDTDPLLIRRLYARQAALHRKSLSADGKSLATPKNPTLDAPPPSAVPSAVPSAALAVPSFYAQPSSYLVDGVLNIGYLSGLPAGHVTYDLVGSMLRFHADRHIKPFWCTAAAEPARVRHGGLKVPWEHVLELGGLKADAAAAKLQNERIGVLIDLDGWIGDEPPRRLMAAHPAPVRGQWLGWAGTTADPSIGYMVTDAYTTPVTTMHGESPYTERLLLLPRAYQLNDHAQLYAHVFAGGGGGSGGGGGGGGGGGSSAMAERELGGGFTLANFNQLMKVTPDLFGVWCGAMLRVPYTRLLLLTGVTNVHVQYPHAARNLDAEMAVRGLRMRRLIKGPVRTKEAHLLRAARSHLAVDTLSYNSHTTGSDVLWSGLPLITQSGRYFAARVGGALIDSAGVPQLHAGSLKHYEDTIHSFATSNPSRRVRHTRDALSSPPPRADVPSPATFGATTFGSSVNFGSHELSWDLAGGRETPGSKAGITNMAGLVGPRPWGKFLKFEPTDNKILPNGEKTQFAARIMAPARGRAT